MSKLLGRTLRDAPKDAELVSHKFLLRSGLARQYAAGIYATLPLAQKSLQKIESIIRQEMDGLGGQEIRMPCLGTQELWEESGRYNKIGKDMMRLKDRHERGMVLNMTHEEPVVALARTELTSYRQLPAFVYQFQSKFRDEPRPRGGLIRLREFIMKDGYSFHENEEDFQTFYWNTHAAYERVYKRVGLKNVLSVASDNGMFGGKFSHEFQLLVDSGEDKLIVCSQCDYRANVEVATSNYALPSMPTMGPLEKIHTPGLKTIESLTASLNIPLYHTAKAVLFQTAEGNGVAVFLRGDLNVLDTKLLGVLKTTVVQAQAETLAQMGACAGSTGPKGLNLEKCRVILDHSLRGLESCVTGANENDYHWSHFHMERDFLNSLDENQRKKVEWADISAVRTGDPCPKCGHELKESRGIEIGNIFHLGTKYTTPMKSTFLDSKGKSHNHVMGCYGIGVTRLLPAIIEESHDDRGIVFPISVAPFDVHVCALNLKEPQVEENCHRLIGHLEGLGLDILWDDRDEKAGSQFADADLIGIPFRIILSPKTLKENGAELKFRDGRQEARLIPIGEIASLVKELVDQEYKKFDV